MHFSRKTFVAVAAGLAVAPRVACADDSAEVEHAVIFRFPAERVAAATDAFRAMELVTRKQPGNLRYDVFKSTADPLTFVIFERWASQAALDAHQQTPEFIEYGRNTLERYATTHDAVTCTPLG